MTSHSLLQPRLREALVSSGAAHYAVGLLLVVLLGLLFGLGTEGSAAFLDAPIMELVVCFSILTWASLAVAIAAGRVRSLYEAMIVSVLAYSPICGMLVTLSPASLKVSSFWLALAAWTGLAVYFTLEKLRIEDRWQQLLASLSVVWTTTTTIISVGTLPFLGYADQPIAGLRSVHALLDIRLVLGTLLFALLLLTGSVEAFQRRPPAWAGLEPPQVPEPRGGRAFDWALVPFVVLANALLVVLTSVAELLLRAIIVVAFYFGQVGWHTAHLLRRLLREKAGSPPVGVGSRESAVGVQVV